MKLFSRSWSPGNVLPATLIASAFIAFAGIMSTLVLPVRDTVDMYLSQENMVHVVGETLSVSVMVSASEPVNVFAGEIRFDPALLTVERIDYNTSIADLWVEKPWYENGAGTVNFGGGTTRPGGFMGDASLLTITFKTLTRGEATLTVRDPRVLRHDGLGSEAPVRPSLDTIIAIEDAPNLLAHLGQDMATEVIVYDEPPRTDLTGDARTTFADISVMMGYLATRDERGDVNRDGNVNVGDLSALMAVRE